ncbi:response regulator [Pseudorhodoferax sp. Leaf265]|jgi:DNA-binding response OmpR family regulator|uniref:response regulator n=1 Tax=Pseudorhodoferax sp. Leaf265 TaxID=1736315 RepID=UPI0006FDDF0E|nr:response regulator [Pseudorhodoferax sp. Leaf265]KQP21269.1 two-component system response regulator [Pseudorhodoferax sp. Leaf265]PZP95853.1 MAG: DNA-binding response regulator [Variovorax paradoxus]PZQ06807.1 MAG: DNA-binding response regulator [Variovorax paradoxus]
MHSLSTHAGAPTPAHVLAVDDDPSVRELISTYLGDHDLRVTAVAREAEMRAVLEREAVQLVLLDLRLKGEDGLAIARDLRAHSKLPIIILTGRTEEADRVMGLELGADDYLTKPFSPRELLARIRALLRRTQMHATLAETVASVRAYRFEGWTLSLRLRRLNDPAGRPVELRNSEFNLLLAFLSAPQRVLTREQLLDLSRLHNAEVYDRSIDVQVGRLRRKIEADPRRPRLIVTERHAGYLFAAEVQSLRD